MLAVRRCVAERFIRLVPIERVWNVERKGWSATSYWEGRMS